MRISIFGMGYVGCVSAACFAEMGHTVVGIESNPLKVEMINSGKSPIVEKDLDSLLLKVVKRKSLRAIKDCAEAVLATDLAIICVGTPSRKNGAIDLRYVERVCEQIGAALTLKDSRLTVVVRSTVMPGTVEGVVIPALEKASGKKAGRDFGVCMHPEFLREGTSIHDFYHPPKTVIGELDRASGDALASLYQTTNFAIIRTALRVAEMVKYADNCFHGLKVAFANEIGNVCKEASIDSHKVMEIFCQDTKLNLSPYYLKPGFAFGGSCLPKDLKALVHEARTLEVEVPVLNAVIESNYRQIQRLVNKLLTYKGRSLGFLGLSFKGGTDDLRSSPIVEVIEAMLGKGFDIKIYDQHVSIAKLMGANREYIEKEIPHLSRLMYGTAAEVVELSDVIVVNHYDVAFARALEQVKPKQVIIDLVRIVDRSHWDGCEYYGMCW